MSLVMEMKGPVAKAGSILKLFKRQGYEGAEYRGEEHHSQERERDSDGGDLSAANLEEIVKENEQRNNAAVDEAYAKLANELSGGIAQCQESRWRDPVRRWQKTACPRYHRCHR